MLKQLKNKNGQSLAIQHSIMFFLVVAIIMSMATYFRRAVQSKIRDVRLFMVKEVKEEFDSDDYQGVGYFSYEPYYVNQMARRVVASNIIRKQFPTLAEEFRFEIDHTSTTDTFTNQLAPKYAN
ncbi:MAG: hypothetical protein KAR05_03415 [Candidatus Omnitrophica bacterium]|nr:hypothetical protein [Candidatus Omnitrophota bacterium]